MSEMESRHWLRPISKSADAHALSLPVEAAFCTAFYQLTEMRTAWHDTRSHLYRGTGSLFELPDEAEEAITILKKSGTYFNVSETIGIEVLSGDNYLIFTHINTSSPFKRWTEPAEWGRLNRSPTLGEIYAAFQPSERERGHSGWPESIQAPDLIIGIGKSQSGHFDWPMPTERAMNNFSSKGVLPGHADDGFEYLKAVDTTFAHTHSLVSAVLSLNETTAKHK
ncbi:hypothetical protein [Paeniglutamicibacter terrestris]|uniref:Uncharacterized protein n=1 Tax=Paeniglutamicibacter terrestris TaxID=2723403 RepID=A0ABX1G0X5_9MICC|nr:hypothetical protein [Paeniglutamicibacter terrestris]NKG19893.1 hypothetical protein [Paeniglutamicibacter terrestris]